MSDNHGATSGGSVPVTSRKFHSGIELVVWHFKESVQRPVDTIKTKALGYLVHCAEA